MIGFWKEAWTIPLLSSGICLARVSDRDAYGYLASRLSLFSINETPGRWGRSKQLRVRLRGRGLDWLKVLIGCPEVVCDPPHEEVVPAAPTSTLQH